jgi:hypothetical protein
LGVLVGLILPLINQLRFAEEIDVKMSHIVGENLSRFIRGEFKILDHLMSEGLLGSYYADSLGFKGANTWTGEIVKQICFRHPRLNILEIGKYSSLDLLHYILHCLFWPLSIS